MISAFAGEFIEFMLGAGVLRFGEFKTKSGRLSPYFVNTGLYCTGAHISQLGQYYARAIVDAQLDKCNALFGPAYKGIPLAVATTCALYRDHGCSMPYLFNRKEAKDHGEGGVFVGYTPKDGDSIVIIEDVITAGSALRETLPTLNAAADLTVEHLFISVDRREVGTDMSTVATDEIKREFGISTHALITAKDVYDYLVNAQKYDEYTAKMRAYMDRYCVL